ncbi:hypothetical protein BJ878DRAFT_483211 [Calycina marina]|uniref:Uncharacterized protein n=1 Tax=Calycina marina TaxID=1763456 RepID=A0A9P7YWQ2_9HELO|nr:hypothetical protein BJ878DRAFT_483211 [Calycina marina]
MAANTRATERVTPPPGFSEGREADTVKFTRVEGGPTRTGTNGGTARRSIKLRKEISSRAYRTTRNTSSILGRKSRIPKDTWKMLCDPRLNPIRTSRYDPIIKYHDLPVSVRQIRRKLDEHADPGQKLLAERHRGLLASMRATILFVPVIKSCDSSQCSTAWRIQAGCYMDMSS